jgi:hypothetical protein
VMGVLGATNNIRARVVCELDDKTSVCRRGGIRSDGRHVLVVARSITVYQEAYKYALNHHQGKAW